MCIIYVTLIIQKLHVMKITRNINYTNISNISFWAVRFISGVVYFFLPKLYFSDYVMCKYYF